jgi:hypothetical protein
MRVHYDLSHYMEEETNWLVLTVTSVVLAMTDNTNFLISGRCSLVSHAFFLYIYIIGLWSWYKHISSTISQDKMKIIGVWSRMLHNYF